MALLGDSAAPRPGWVYDMPPDSYDVTDRIGHPVVVVSVDAARKVAYVATRTSKANRKGPNGLGHKADRDLGFEKPGWWRLHDLHEVPYSLFSPEEDCAARGCLDDQTWTSLTRRLREGP